MCERLVGLGDEVVCVDNLMTGPMENLAHLPDRPTMTFLHQPARSTEVPKSTHRPSTTGVM
jgi:hypothetical protein